MAGSLRNLGAVVSHAMDQDTLPEIRFHCDIVRSWSASDLAELTRALASHFVAQGIKPGTRVACVSENSVELLAALLAVMQIGAIAVPLNPRMDANTLHDTLKDCDPALVLYQDGLEIAMPSETGTQTLTALIAAISATSNLGYRSEYIPAPNDPALILYTSGSSGRPKGVVLSHQSQISGFETMAAMVAAMGRPRILVAAPLFHMNGLNAALTTLVFGGCLSLMQRFDPEQMWSVIAQDRPQIVGGVPTMFALLTAQARALGQINDDVRLIISGSAALPLRLAKDIQAAFPKAIVRNGYGTTEIGAGVFGPHPKGLDQPLLSIGCPTPMVNVRLVGGPDENEGELQVSGPGLASGFWRRPALTEEKFQNGYYATGDTMRRDSDGFYYVLGRSDDMFKSGGEAVYPAEVERYVANHPSVAQVAVIPIPDNVYGHVPAAFVVLVPGTELDLETLQSDVRKDAPAYLCPRALHILNAFPLTGPGKIDKAALQSIAL